MFDWFRKYKKSEGSVAEDMNNVVKFPELKAIPPMPKVEPPQPEPKIFYRIGVTDTNRVAFSMGHMEITMNKEGCQNMIDQLTVFMNQVEDEIEE